MLGLQLSSVSKSESVVELDRFPKLFCKFKPARAVPSLIFTFSSCFLHESVHAVSRKERRRIQRSLCPSDGNWSFSIHAERK